jgi:hypothetical protein
MACPCEIRRSGNPSQWALPLDGTDCISAYNLSATADGWFSREGFRIAREKAEDYLSCMDRNNSGAGDVKESWRP